MLDLVLDYVNNSVVLRNLWVKNQLSFDWIRGDTIFPDRFITPQSLRSFVCFHSQAPISSPLSCWRWFSDMNLSGVLMFLSFQSLLYRVTNPPDRSWSWSCDLARDHSPFLFTLKVSGLWMETKFYLARYYVCLCRLKGINPVVCLFATFFTSRRNHSSPTRYWRMQTRGKCSIDVLARAIRWVHPWMGSLI